MILEVNRSYDVVVLGGGPSASSSALALAQKSVSVLVVEKQKPFIFKVGESLPGIAGSVLSRAGFPNLLSRVPNLQCSGNRSLWGSRELQFRSGLLNPYGGGLHIDRAEFDQQLRSEAASFGAQLLYGARCEGFIRSKSGWTISLRYGMSLHHIDCTAIIDCTGRHACFARTQGARRIVADKLVAIVSVLSGIGLLDSDLTTTVEATSHGWWYTARLPGQKRIVAFFSEGGLIRGLQVRSSAGFVDHMRETTLITKYLDAGYVMADKPLPVLADTSFLNCSAGPGWCAAGDAASALDPLASMGIINALQSGTAAANLVLSGFVGSNEYTKAVISRAIDDIKMRKSFYQIEQRWPHEPFWIQKHRERNVETSFDPTHSPTGGAQNNNTMAAN